LTATLSRTASTAGWAAVPDWKNQIKNQIKICHRVLTRTWSSGGTLVAAIGGENKRPVVHCGQSLVKSADNGSVEYIVHSFTVTLI